MEIRSETRTYRLTGKTSLLGSNPANPEIYSAYVGSKAASVQKAYEEEMMLPTAEELQEKIGQIKGMGLTVFLRNGRGQLVLASHVIKGYFKGTFQTLKDQIGIGGAKSKVDNLIFVESEYIPIMSRGEPVTEPDGYNERSLRAETMQGPRVSLASSEEIDVPWNIDVELRLIENSGTAKSKPVTWEAIETALNYGRHKGLGQWRNSGKGCFTWERIG